jgi:hypothetical protein
MIIDEMMMIRIIRTMMITDRITYNHIAYIIEG